MSPVAFLALVGGLLIGAIVLAVVVKNLAEGFTFGGKRPFVYGFIAAILTSAVALWTSYISNVPSELFWYLGGIFLLYSIIHVMLHITGIFMLTNTTAIKYYLQRFCSAYQ